MPNPVNPHPTAYQPVAKNFLNRDAHAGRQHSFTFQICDWAYSLERYGYATICLEPDERSWDGGVNVHLACRWRLALEAPTRLGGWGMHERSSLDLGAAREPDDDSGLHELFMMPFADFPRRRPNIDEQFLWVQLHQYDLPEVEREPEFWAERGAAGKIIQCLKPWPESLLRKKFIAELSGAPMPWHNPANLTLPIVRHMRTEDRMWEARRAEIGRGPLRRESPDEFDARLDRDAPHPNTLPAPSPRVRMEA